MSDAVRQKPAPTKDQIIVRLERRIKALERTVRRYREDVADLQTKLHVSTSVAKQLEMSHFNRDHLAERLATLQANHHREILAWVVELARVKHEPIPAEFEQVPPPDVLLPRTS